MPFLPYADLSARNVSLTKRASVGTGSFTTCSASSFGSTAEMAVTNPAVGDVLDNSISTPVGRAAVRVTPYGGGAVGSGAAIETLDTSAVSRPTNESTSDAGGNSSAHIVFGSPSRARSGTNASAPGRDG